MNPSCLTLQPRTKAAETNSLSPSATSLSLDGGCLQSNILVSYIILTRLIKSSFQQKYALEPDWNFTSSIYHPPTHQLSLSFLWVDTKQLFGTQIWGPFPTAGGWRCGYKFRRCLYWIPQFSRVRPSFWVLLGVLTELSPTICALWLRSQTALTQTQYSLQTIWMGEDLASCHSVLKLPSKTTI